MDNIVRVELDALEDEVVHDIVRHERRKEKDARVEVGAKPLVVVRGAGEGVEREHRAADHVEVHLEVNAVLEERHLLGPPQPKCRQGILHFAPGLG